jgi:hypothetical protein
MKLTLMFQLKRSFHAKLARRLKKRNLKRSQELQRKGKLRRNPKLRRKAKLKGNKEKPNQHVQRGRSSGMILKMSWRILMKSLMIWKKVK